MVCLSVSCELLAAAQGKPNSNGTTSLVPAPGTPLSWESSSHFHGKRENGLITDVSTTYLAVRFPSYFMSCAPESYPKGLQRQRVSRSTEEPPRVPLLCLRRKGKKNYIYNIMNFLESNAPKGNAFSLQFKIVLGIGNFSKFNIQLQEQLKLLQILQT